ncbi:MAG: hypothetical protein MJ156_02685 [Alphaproteobacteria bacterium]|nr:hypothetical protein [Alphaproteobacteria bacterium]
MKWNELLHNIPKVTPNYNFSASANVLNLDVHYAIGVKTLTFTGAIRSAKHSKQYSLVITFTKVEPTDGLTESEILKGYMPKPSLKEHDIQVRCSCPTYRFRFDKANRMDRVAAGARFGNYHRLTNRAPNNPHDIPGFCYHVIEFVEYLQLKGFIH